MPDNPGATDIAQGPYLEVFGRFWDGMSFLIASSRATLDRLAPARGRLVVTLPSATEILEEYAAGAGSGVEWPAEFLAWQTYAYTVIEAHGLLDEYLRASYELLLLAAEVDARVDSAMGWDIDAGEQVARLESDVREESERFEQLALWSRVGRLRARFGMDVRIGRPLEAALKHHRRIRNGVVHGHLTPHVVMPDGTIGRMQAYPPPPYIPLGLHVVRGAISVMLAAHRQVDSGILAYLGLAEDPATERLIEAEIESGRGEWFVDPWEPHPEHLFDEGVLRAWRPAR